MRLRRSIRVPAGRQGQAASHAGGLSDDEVADIEKLFDRIGQLSSRLLRVSERPGYMDGTRRQISR